MKVGVFIALICAACSGGRPPAASPAPAASPPAAAPPPSVAQAGPEASPATPDAAAPSAKVPHGKQVKDFKLRPVAPLTRAVLTRDRGQVRALLEAGADPNQLDHGMRIWDWGILIRDQPILDLLLAKSTIAADDASVSLRAAAGMDNRILARWLIDRGVSPSDKFDGRPTALIVASANGYLDMMTLLLDAGADVNQQDVHGDTPLMAAVRDGYVKAVQLLLRRKADPNLKDKQGRTALDWANRYERRDLAGLLTRAGGQAGGAAVQRSPRRTPREAVDASLALLPGLSSQWLEKVGCPSCHHQVMTLRTVGIAAQLGVPLDPKFDKSMHDWVDNVLEQQGSFAQQALTATDGVLAAHLRNTGNGAFKWGLSLSAAIDASHPGGKAEQSMALVLGRMQREDGSWWHGFWRFPVESSDFTATANAVRALKIYGSPEHEAELAERIARGRKWLLRHDPVSNEDAVHKLLGLSWSDADRASVRKAGTRLLRTQRADGGWSQLPGRNSDAYSTGQALVALAQTGIVRASSRAYRRGVDYLVRTQTADGTWFMHSRAFPHAVYVESGSPHGKFQYMSFAGTNHATAALLYAIAPAKPRHGKSRGTGRTGRLAGTPQR